MKILFHTLLRVKNHLTLFIISIVTLLGLIVFNLLEKLMFGAIAKSGNQFIGGNEGRIAGAISSFQEFMGLNSETLSALAITFLIVALGKAIFLFTNKYLTKILSVRICRDLRNQCFAHLQTLPLSFFSRYDRGKLSSRVITDANQIALSFNSFVTNYIHMPFVVITTLAVCLKLSWQLTSIVFVGVPFVMLPLKFITKKIKDKSHKMQQKQESFTSVIIDHLSGIFTIKSYQLEDYSIRKYREENAKMVAFDEKVQKYDTMSRPITHFCMTVMLLFIMWIGIHVLGLSFPDLVVYCLALHALYPPFKQFSDENANVQKGVVSATRLQDILKQESEHKEEGIDEVDKLENSIEFKHVDFSYGNEPVLEGVSFALNKGEVLAVVGSTGSGKSTLLKLFSNLYEIGGGNILFDGKDISTIKLCSLREQFSVVSQEPFFFNDTIRANLVFDAHIAEEEMIEASKKACIHDFVMTQDLGYDTVVEEMGKNLSGGQKQRLAIARALLRDSSILLLDEATSSLDAVSEKMISTALSGLKGDITQVIVAHRLSTIQHADKVLFLEHGKIKSFGTLNQVMEQSKGFAAMWEASKLEFV